MCPWLCGFEGTSIFLDADMLVLGDIYELASMASEEAAVSLVKNRLELEWCSMMIFANNRCKVLSPDFVGANSNPLFDLSWANIVHGLPGEWNHCVGYDTPRNDAKLVHFTQGIPFHDEVSDTEYVEEWRAELENCVSSVSWQEMMGDSVHAKHVFARIAS